MALSSTDYLVRNNARVVLLNDLNQLLLMKVELPDRIFWCTIGGGMEADETAESAVQREVAEEIGFSNEDVIWGNPIWYGEQVLPRNGVLMLHKETFVLGYTRRRNIDARGMTSEEKNVVKELKWWALRDLKTTTEFIVPPSMIHHIEPIMDGLIPEAVVTIDLTNTPPKG